MLAVDARHAIQQVSLQTQGDRGTGGFLDGIAGPGNVDILDHFAIQLAAGGIVAEVGNEPVDQLVSRAVSAICLWMFCVFWLEARGGRGGDRAAWCQIDKKERKHTIQSRRHIEGSRELAEQVSNASGGASWGRTTYSRESKTYSCSSDASIARVSERSWKMDRFTMLRKRRVSGRALKDNGGKERRLSSLAVRGKEGETKQKKVGWEESK